MRCGIPRAANIRLQVFRIMSALKTRPHAAPKYTWEIARFFPEQGNWTEEDYFELEDRFCGGIRVEFDDGRLEFLPLPTQSHQRVILYLLGLLQAFTAVHAPGEILFSGMRIRLTARQRTLFR